MLKVGTILDFTEPSDNSPFCGVVVHDKDLDVDVVYLSNGGFEYFYNLSKWGDYHEITDEEEYTKFLVYLVETFEEDDVEFIIKFLEKYKKLKPTQAQ